MTAIGPGTEVTLHFALKLDNGSVIDSTFDAKPATFKFGDGNLPAGFEKPLIGMKAGEQATYRILPEQGFGQPNPNNLQTFSKQDFSTDIELVPGTAVNFAAADKSELTGVVKSIEDETVVVDFNHPLAGQELLFEVKIEAVEVIDI